MFETQFFSLLGLSIDSVAAVLTLAFIVKLLWEGVEGVERTQGERQPVRSGLEQSLFGRSRLPVIVVTVVGHDVLVVW